MSITLRIQRTVGQGDRSFTLDVDIHTQAQRIALFGPSGSGKTLTVQAVAGLLRPDAGHIAINDRVLFCAEKGVMVSPQKRRLAYLLQDYGLFPHLTVAQNICYGLRHSWWNPSRKLLPPVAQRWVKAFELDAVLHNYPAEISGGQKQRTALARALAVEPDLLILDEPLAALDVHLRRKMRVELRELQQQLDIPSIIITHDPEDAVVLADEVYRIRRGQIEGSCTPAALQAESESQLAQEEVG